MHMSLPLPPSSLHNLLVLCWCVFAALSTFSSSSSSSPSASLVLTATALKFDFKLKRDKRRVIDIGVFGYSSAGKLSLTVEDFELFVGKTAQVKSGYRTTGDAQQAQVSPPAENAMWGEEPVGFALAWVASVADARRERTLYNNRLSASSSGGGVGTQLALADAAASEFSISASDPAKMRNENNDKNKKNLLKCFEDHLELRTKHIMRLPKTEHIISITEPGYYALFFYNCQQLRNGTTAATNVSTTVARVEKFNDDIEAFPKPIKTTLKVRVSEWNDGVSGVPGIGAPKSFLPTGDDALPSLYLFFGVLFGIVTIYWYFLLKRGKNFVNPFTSLCQSALAISGGGGGGGANGKSGGGGGGRHVTFSTPTTTAASRGEANGASYNVHRVHYFMFALLFVKSFQLFLEAFVMHTRKTTGELGTGLDYLYYVTAACKGVMLMTCIVMLGTGYSTLKPFLTDREQKVILLIVPFQFLLNIVQAILEQTSEGDPLWLWWRNFLSVLDIAGGFLVLLPLLWYFSVRHDATSSSNAPSSPGGEDTEMAATNRRNINTNKAAAATAEQSAEARLNSALARRDAARKTQFITFYVSVILFIYFTRIIVPHIQTTLPYDQTWIAAACYEASALLFYALSGRAFGPQAINSVFSPAEKDMGSSSGGGGFDDDDEDYSNMLPAGRSTTTSTTSINMTSSSSSSNAGTSATTAAASNNPNGKKSGSGSNIERNKLLDDAGEVDLSD